MRSALIGAAIMVAALSYPAPALGDNATLPPSISVSGTGNVTFTPDIARVSLGIRAESLSAAEAAAAVNGRAQNVIAALRRLGIPDRDIATSNYSLEYVEPPRPTPPPQGGVVTIGRGHYVATEAVEVKSRVSRAGAVIDAGIGAGANLTYGLSFDTSGRDALYRQALARAVANARSQAAVMAAAAGVKIDGVLSLSTGAPQIVYPLARAAAFEAAPAPPIQPGTDTITATVQMTFRIR